MAYSTYYDYNGNPVTEPAEGVFYYDYKGQPVPNPIDGGRDTSASPNVYQSPNLVPPDNVTIAPKTYDKDGNVVSDPKSGEFYYDAIGNPIPNPVDGTIDTTQTQQENRTSEQGRQWGITGIFDEKRADALAKISALENQVYRDHLTNYYGQDVSGSFQDGFTTVRGDLTIYEFPPPRKSWGGQALPPHRIWMRDYNAKMAVVFHIPPEELKWETSANWANAGIGGVITDPIQWTGGSPFTIQAKFPLIVEYPTQMNVTLQPFIDIMKRTKGHLLRFIFGSTYFTDSYAMSGNDELALGGQVQSSKELEGYNVVWEKLSFDVKLRHPISYLPTYAEMSMTLKQR